MTYAMLASPYFGLSLALFTCAVAAFGVVTATAAMRRAAADNTATRPLQADSSLATTAPKVMLATWIMLIGVNLIVVALKLFELWRAHPAR